MLARNTSKAIDNLSRADLIELVVALQRQVAALSAQVGKLQADNDLLKRQQARQAAPFSQGKRLHKPKRPGRQPGSGRFCYRHAPVFEHLSGAPVDVPVTACSWPVSLVRLSVKVSAMRNSITSPGTLS